MKKNNRIIITVLITVFIGIITVIPLLKNSLNAESVQKQELININLNASVFDENGNKIYLNESDNIIIVKEEDIIQENNDFKLRDSASNLSYVVNNGDILVEIPLYDYSINEGDINKNISIDNSIHNTLIKNAAFINTKEASKFITATYTKESTNKLDVELDNYYIFLNNRNCTLSWNISKELEQTFTTDTYNLNLTVTNSSNYSNNEIQYIYGDSTINSFDVPCSYRDVTIENNESGEQLNFELESKDIYSIADGEIIDINDVENYVLVKYNEGLLMKYQDVVSSNMSYVEKGELIGYALNDNFRLITIDNGEFIASEWLYDGFERPLEGPNVPRMYQMDERWYDIPYGTNTIGGGGCGPTSFAMTVSALTGKVYTPDEIVDTIKSLGNGTWYYEKGVGSCYSIFGELCDYYGLGLDENFQISEDAVREKLNEGKIVIISVSRGNIYTGDGHFIVIRGLTDDGKFLINDSAHYFDLNTGYEWDDIRPVNSARAIYK